MLLSRTLSKEKEKEDDQLIERSMAPRLVDRPMSPSEDLQDLLLLRRQLLERPNIPPYDHSTSPTSPPQTPRKTHSSKPRGVPFDASNMSPSTPSPSPRKHWQNTHLDQGSRYNSPPATPRSYTSNESRTSGTSTPTRSTDPTQGRSKPTPSPSPKLRKRRRSTGLRGEYRKALDCDSLGIGGVDVGKNGNDRSAEVSVRLVTSTTSPNGSPIMTREHQQTYQMSKSRAGSKARTPSPASKAFTPFIFRKCNSVDRSGTSSSEGEECGVSFFGAIRSRKVGNENSISVFSDAPSPSSRISSPIPISQRFLFKAPPSSPATAIVRDASTPSTVLLPSPSLNEPRLPEGTSTPPTRAHAAKKLVKQRSGTMAVPTNINLPSPCRPFNDLKESTAGVLHRPARRKASLRPVSLLSSPSAVIHEEGPQSSVPSSTSVSSVPSATMHGEDSPSPSIALPIESLAAQVDESDIPSSVPQISEVAKLRKPQLVVVGKPSNRTRGSTHCEAVAVKSVRAKVGYRYSSKGDSEGEDEDRTSSTPKSSIGSGSMRRRKGWSPGRASAIPPKLGMLKKNGSPRPSPLSMHRVNASEIARNEDEEKDGDYGGESKGIALKSANKAPPSDSASRRKTLLPMLPKIGIKNKLKWRATPNALVSGQCFTGRYIPPSFDTIRRGRYRLPSES